MKAAGIFVRVAYLPRLLNKPSNYFKLTWAGCKLTRHKLRTTRVRRLFTGPEV